MGEHPPLSDEEIMAITIQRMGLESGPGLADVTVTAEFPGSRPHTGT